MTTLMILHAILRIVYYVYLDHIFSEVLYARSKAIFHMMHYLNWMNYDFTYTHKVLSLLNNANVICLMILELLAFYVSKNVPLFVFYMNFVLVF